VTKTKIYQNFGLAVGYDRSIDVLFTIEN